MRVDEERTRVFGLAWLIVVAAMVVVVGLWSTSLSSRLTAGHEAPVASPAHLVNVPTVVTLLTDNVPRSTAQTKEALCAELSPRVPSVTVETSSGKVIQQIDCTP